MPDIARDMTQGAIRIADGQTPGRRAAGGRDHRVDLMRGIALTCIFINHMPGNWVGNWTPRNFGFSDAAELFVLMAGFAAAMAYGGFAARGQIADLCRKALRRAGTLYGAHLLTTTAAIALFTAVISATSETVDLVGVSPFLANPKTGAMALVVGGFQLSYFNILPMYVVLIALLPGMLLLVCRDVRLLAAASSAGYMLAHMTGAKLPAMGDYDSWYFNPIAWQSLFAIGLVVGMRVRDGKGIPYNALAYWSAATYLVFAFGWRMMTSDDVGAGLLPYWIGSLQKPNLPLARLLHVLALAYVVCHSRIWTRAAIVPSGFIVTRMGRNSLPIFMLGSLLSMSGWLLVNITDAGPFCQLAIVVAGFVAMAGLALWLERSPSPSASRAQMAPQKAPQAAT